MEPSTDENLTRFVEAFHKTGQYVLAYALMDNHSRPPRLMIGDSIAKCHLHVREAWEVGRHDLDSVGVNPDDNPIVPVSQQDPPVRELIKWKRSLLID